jgi:UDP-N-acetylglucosamine 1-carboxyvinyltransferase
MDIKIKGGQVLSGEIMPSGSKNSAVHLLPSTLLFNKPVNFENVPDITDVSKLIEIIKEFGGIVNWDKEKKLLFIDNSKLKYKKLDKSKIGNMRGTSILWGGLLARFGKVDFDDLPGGCTLGVRPFEPIYKIFREFGIDVEESSRGVHMKVPSAGMDKDREVWLTEMSPTATTNLIILASSLTSKTKIIGASSEPQVQDVCNFLVKGGVKISGIGSSTLEIEGTGGFSSVTHRILPDHYEITTFLALGAATGGEIKVMESYPWLTKPMEYEMSKFNIKVEYNGNEVRVPKNQNIRFTGSFEDKTNIVRAQPWPFLPVDLIPIFIPLALAAPDGYMMFHNWMYESGLFWSQELNKLGAEVVMCDPHRVIVMGGKKMVGAELEAPYIIRAVVSMMMSAMLAKGETTILNADFRKLV